MAQNKNVSLKASVRTFASSSTTPKLNVPQGTYEGIVEEWQVKAYIHNKHIPEISFSNRLVAGNFARGKLRILEKKETKRGGINNVPTKNADVLKLLDTLTGSFGSHSSLLYGFAHNLVIAGDCFLVGIPVRHPVTRKIVKLDWQVVSIRQLVKMQAPGQKEDIIALRDERGNKEPLPPGSYFARCWVPDPEFTSSADSPMKHNQELCLEVITLSNLITVIAKSRLNSGIFAVADELSFGPVDEVTDDSSEDEDDLDPFERDYLRQTTATLDNPYDLSAFAPMLMRGAKDYLPTKENYITFERPLDDLILRLREDGIVRIVRGLDLPSELVTGKGDTNSWSGFGIDQDFITKHLEPLGLVVSNFLTRKYLRPFLIQNGMSWEEAERYDIFYDSSDIAVKPDQTKTALELFDRNAIGEDALRRLSGIEEADAPTKDEFIRQVVLNLSKLSAPIASALLPLLPEFAPFKQELLDAVQVGPLPKVDPGSAGADSKAKTPDPQTPGAQDTRGQPPAGRNTEVKKRSTQRGESSSTQ